VLKVLVAPRVEQVKGLLEAISTAIQLSVP